MERRSVVYAEFARRKALPIAAHSRVGVSATGAGDYKNIIRPAPGRYQLGYQLKMSRKICKKWGE